MKPSKPLLAAGIAAWAVLAATGCGAQAAPSASGTDVFVFLDLTASVTPAQRELWKSEAARLTTRLNDNSSIAVYAIHDHTMDAAQLYHAEIPAPAGDGTRSDAQRQKVARTEARKGSLEAISAALDAGGQAPRTDIFSAIDRVHETGNRHLEIYFLSDMLNSTPDLNMEIPGSLTRASISDRIHQLAQRHTWRTGQLAGAEVYCVLNSIASNGHGPAVDRLTQQAFYQALFESLGAHLALYDTNLSNPSEGGNYVVQNR